MGLNTGMCEERAVARSAGSRSFFWPTLGLTPQALRCHPLPRVKKLHLATRIPSIHSQPFECRAGSINRIPSFENSAGPVD